MSRGQSHRRPEGGFVDRSQSVSFRFNGKNYEGYRGDTLASALLANGVRLVGRSFKYHRPRGILTAGPEEPNALVEVGTGSRREPNSKATTIELHDSLEATSQNCWPSLRLDLMAVNQLVSPLLVGGFYYKTFMWPASFWEKVYEPMIRRAAGLGRASRLPDPDRYETATAHCDVLVIGSGPAGLAAARAAGRSGARVILCEDDFCLGGRLLSERREINGQPCGLWAQQVEQELAALPEVRIMRRTQVFGVYDGGTYGAIERVADHLPVPPDHYPRQRFWRIVARRSINAMGAIERPLVFGGNDRPGVMMASALRTYVNRFAVVPGRRLAVFTTTDSGWTTAFDLAAAGIQVEAVIDARTDVADDILIRAAKTGARLLLGWTVCEAKGGPGGLRWVDVRKGAELLRLNVDTLAVSGGWNPQVALTTHTGTKPRWSDDLSTFIPDGLPDGMSVVGAAHGDFSLAACLREGTRAGAVAAAEAGFEGRAAEAPVADDEPVASQALWNVAGSRRKAFVDFQNDVTTKDIEIAHREGFRSVEHLKRYTTLGMATDQGKTSNVNGHALMATLTGRTVAQTGTTVSRAPHLPVAIGALAGLHRGKHYRPTRFLAAHDWALAHGATMVESGQWLRPQWFARAGETDWLESVNREVLTVRSAVGICDMSTLGKIDIQGKDAGAFLDRVYINMFSTLPIGKARYGVMLREDGFVLDDGTTARLGPEHYVMSTTTANAGKVMQHLEFCRQVLWPELNVAIASVTEQWSQYAVAGPSSRELLQRVLGSAFDLSPEAFPHLACAAFQIGEVPARLFRLSFSGERAYEIAVPSRYGDGLLRALMKACEKLGGTAYGTEALNVLRIEKGHVSGNELNGQTTAHDLGLGRMMSTKKDFIGCVLAKRPALVASDRPALVGIKPADPRQRLRAGAHFVPVGAAPAAENAEGHVTSVAFSPHLERWIGLGLVRRGPERIGERLRAYDPVRGGDVEVEVVSTVFVDATGERLHG